MTLSPSLHPAAAAVAAGETPPQAAARYGVSIPFVRRVCRENGIALPGEAPTSPALQYQPSPAARESLRLLGVDLDVVHPHRPECSERDAGVCDTALSEPISAAQIGERYGVSSERVRQILRMNTTLRWPDLSGLHADARAAINHEARIAKARLIAQNEPSKSPGRIARQVGVPTADVVALLGVEETERRRREAQLAATRRARVPDEDLGEMLRAAADRLPEGTYLTKANYDALRRPGDFSAATMTARYGTWRNTCARHGVQCSPNKTRAYVRKWNTDALLDSVEAYLAQTSRPNLADFVAWSSERRGEGRPSAYTVVFYLERWSTAVAMAKERAAQRMPHDLPVAA